MRRQSNMKEGEVKSREGATYTYDATRKYCATCYGSGMVRHDGDTFKPCTCRSPQFTVMSWSDMYLADEQ